MVEAKDRNGPENNEGLVSLIHPVFDISSSQAREAKRVYIQGRVTAPARRSTKGGWTVEEQFSGCIAGKEFSILILSNDSGRMEEDDLIIELVGKQGNEKWSDMAKHLPGRIGKQCRERWHHNHLNPDRERATWAKARRRNWFSLTSNKT